MSHPTSQSPRVVSLLLTGQFVMRPCAWCARTHLALRIAPDDAPCLRCAQRCAPPTPPAAREWSPKFRAFLVEEARMSVQIR